jgi:hypothetical protein
MKSQEREEIAAKVAVFMEQVARARSGSGARKPALGWIAVSTKHQAAGDKVSLEDQFAKITEWCEANDHYLIDLLVVPGHSRNYYNFSEFLVDAAKENIDAPSKLLHYIDKKAFRVFLCWDGTRFGREQSIFAEVVARIIDSGANVYSITEGWADKANYRYYSAIGGLKAASQLDDMQAKFQSGMTQRSKLGLPVSSRPFWAHRLIRNPESGKAEYLELDPDKKHIIDAVAELILEGVSWMTMEKELYLRYGIVNQDGRVFSHNFFYKRVYHPAWWGHSARHFRTEHHPNGQKTDLWVFDADEPLPDGVVIHRDVLPAVWEGEIAERIKAELRRRRMAIRGSARSIRTRRFTGLLICGGCGYVMKYLLSGSKWVALGCSTRWWTSDIRPTCEQTHSINERTVQEWFDVRLRHMLEAGNPAAFMPDQTPAVEDTEARMQSLKAEIAAIEGQIRNLIVKQADAPASTGHLYDDEINIRGQRLVYLQDQLRQAETITAAASAAILSPQIAYDQIAKMGVDGFWELDQKRQNQLLHAIMGKRRLVILERQIKQLSQANPRVRQHRK